MTKKILITSVSAGSGHVRAAQAIEAGFRRSHRSIEVKHVDVMDYVSRPFRHLYVGGYSFAVTHAPRLWGELYYRTNRSPRTPAVQPLLDSIQRSQASDFLEMIENYQPDLILTTHFLIPQLLADGVDRFRVPIETVVTDYELHQFWFNPSVRRYFVATEAMADRLQNLGVEASRIVVSGIPVHPVFADPTAKADALTRLRLESGLPTIVLMSGGFGFGALEKTVEALFEFPSDIQLVTISGKNAAMQSRLEHLKPPARVRLKNFGFVTNMQDFMTVADLVVTKPGGLTVSECLVKGNAMLLYSPIPGQEEANAAYVQGIGAGLKTDSARELTEAIRNLLGSSLVELMKKNALAHSHPRAVYTIADLSVSSLNAA